VRFFPSVVAVSVLSLSLSALPLAAGSPQASAAETAGSTGVGTFVLTPEQPADIDGLAATLSTEGVEVIGLLREVGRVIVASERDVHELGLLPGVAAARPSIGLTPLLSESARVIESDVTAALGFTGAGRSVVVIDSGVEKSHPALAGAVVHEACFLQGTAGGVCPESGRNSSIGSGSAAPCVFSAVRCAHGTHVAGIVASRDASRPGVAPDATVIAIRVMAENGLIGSAGLLAALDHVASIAADHDIVAVNMSLGTFKNPCVDPDMSAAVARLAALDIAVIAASGNGPFTAVAYPGCLPGIVAVGSSEPTDSGRIVSEFTGYEGDLDFVAPGRSIVSAVTTAEDPSGFAEKTGSSMAVPHVAGALAVLAEAHPSWPTARLVGLLSSTGTSVPRFERSQVVGRYAEPRLAAAVGFQPFVDSGSAFSQVAVDWAKATGVSQGIGGGVFGHDRSMTRAEIAAVIWRLFDRPPPSAPAPFVDVPAGSFYADAVAWLYERGVTTGTTPTAFSPNDLVNRAQIATLLWKAVGTPDASPPNFSDVASGQYYTDAVGWMVRWGITTGTSSTTFSPNLYASREQTFTFIWRLAHSRSAWASEEVPDWVLS